MATPNYVRRWIAAGKPRRGPEYYQYRKASGLARGFTPYQARGHPEEAGKGKPRLGIREARRIRSSFDIEPPDNVKIVKDRDRVVVTDASGEVRIFNRTEWDQVRPRRRRRKGELRPNIFDTGSPRVRGIRWVAT